MKHHLPFSLFLLFSFSLSAQTACDSLDFVSVKYSPFTDTVVIVEVRNNNQWEIFDYPGFVLLDTDDDTVAVETVNYFGIGSESLHLLEVRPGVHDPLINFEGTLQLYSEFYDTFECEWDLDQSLCSIQPCDSVILGFQNFGGALVLGDFHWTVEDESAAIVDSGSFTMEAQGQYWFNKICLEPGAYSYSLTALTPPSGGGPTLTVSTSSAFASPTMSEPLDWFNDPGAVIEFPFFEFCAGSPNGIKEVLEQVEIKVLRNGDDVVLQSTESINSALIYSTDGKLVASLSPNSTQFQFPAGLRNGVYLIRIETKKGLTTVKVVR